LGERKKVLIQYSYVFFALFLFSSDAKFDHMLPVFRFVTITNHWKKYEEGFAANQGFSRWSLWMFT
jgi:hypothetical protein